MVLYDATIFLGRSTGLDPFQHSGIEALKRMLEKYRIQKALVISFGNEITFQAAEHDDRLIPCPAVIGNCAGEIGEEGAFLRALLRSIPNPSACP